MSPVAVGPGSVLHFESRGAISWGAIIVGALVAVAIGIALTALGSGIGLSIGADAIGDAVRDRPDASSVSIWSAIWLLIVNLAAMFAGGYVAGRARPTPSAEFVHESRFRDSTHGFGVWAVGTIVTVLLVAATATSIAGYALRGAGAAVSGAASAVGSVGSEALQTVDAGQVRYYANRLLRSDGPASVEPAQAQEAITDVLAQAWTSGEIDQQDRDYLARLIAAQTQMSEQQAAQRVDQIAQEINSTRTAIQDTAAQAAEAATRAGAYLAFWSFIAMLVGLGGATFGALAGGRARHA